MKKILLLSFVLAIALSACGQTGPLYLPKNAPKVYDEPTLQPTDTKKQKKPKPESPPLPEKPKPATEQ